MQPLSDSEIDRLPVRRLDAYRQRLLALEEAAASSDLEPSEIEALDQSLIHFKDGPRWGVIMSKVLRRLR